MLGGSRGTCRRAAGWACSLHEVALDVPPTWNGMLNTCAYCEDEAIAVIGAAPACTRCLRARAFKYHRSLGEVLALIQRLALLGDRLPEAAVASARRHAAPRQVIADVLQTMAKDGSAVQRYMELRTKPLTADNLIASDLRELLDSDYGLDQWIAEADYIWLLRHCATHSDISMHDLFHVEEHSVHLIWVKRYLLGATLAPHDFLEEPALSVLRSVPALSFCLGLARLVEIAAALRDGMPLSDRFSDDERQLLLDFEPETVRRAARSWHLLDDYADSLPAYNDRAERLLRLWLLHPVSGPLRGYLACAYRAYVTGEHVATVILARAVLERVVRDCDMLLHSAGPSTMLERIGRLERSGKLTRAAARSARAVWIRGNKTIHETPAAAGDAFQVIAATLAVAAELVPGSQAAPSDV